MGILSSIGLPCTGKFHEYDFSSDSSQVYGGTAGYKLLGDSIWGMVCGDIDANGLINGYDKEQWSLNAGAYGYDTKDVNLDGEVNNQDKYLWDMNHPYIIQVPE